METEMLKSKSKKIRYLWSASPISCKRKLKLLIIHQSISSTHQSQLFSWMRRVKSSLSCSGSDPGRLPGYSQSKSSPSKSNLERSIWLCYLIVLLIDYLSNICLLVQHMLTCPTYAYLSNICLPVQHMHTTVHKDLPLGRVQCHLNKTILFDGSWK